MESNQLENSNSADKLGKKTVGGKKHNFIGIANIIGILLCILMLPGFIISTTLFASSLIHSDLPPSCFGYTPLIVETGSMSPVFDEEDVVLIKNSTPDMSFDVDDIICYHSGNVYVTHRIIEVTTDENGITLYTTKGDANNAADEEAVHQDQILGIYKTRFKAMGKTLMFIQTPAGMILCVMIPFCIVLLLFFVPPLIAARKKENSSKEEHSIR